MIDYLNTHFLWVAALLAVLNAGLFFVVLKLRRRKTRLSLGLDELVTLNSGGWALLATVAAIGGVVMIGSSAAIGIDYWTGLAVDADIKAGNIDQDSKSALKYLTVGVISFFFLAAVFEIFSDLGAPWASGFAQRKRRSILPQLIAAATVLCIVMSIVTKWGYYDDKQNARVNDVERQTIEDTVWHKQRDEAQATIDRLSDAPTTAEADAKETAANDAIDQLERQIQAAAENLARLPESHSTNRLKAQEGINELNDDLAAARADLVVVATMRADVERLKQARADRQDAIDKIKDLVGGGDDAKKPAGDLLWVRILRVGVHQFLCWLFPLIFFESVDAFGESRKRERANARRREANADRANTVDAEFAPINTEPKMLGAQGHYDDKSAAEEEEVKELKRRRKLEDSSETNLQGDRDTDETGGEDEGSKQ